MHSYKNTSPGRDPGKKMKIGEVKDPKPPAGASNSYEKVLNKIDAHDNRAVNAHHYTKEKMANK